MGLFTDGFKLLKKASEPLYKTPKSIQETIEIMAVAENGSFDGKGYPDTIFCSTISVIIKISPSFQKKMTEIFAMFGL